MITHSKASLSIYSDTHTHTAAEVTRALGIEPTRSAEKGDPRGKARLDASENPAKRYYFKHSFWDFQVDDEPDGTSSVLRLAEALSGKADVLAQLRQNYRTSIWFYGSSDSTQAGFVYPAEVLAALAPLGCDLHFDIYLDERHPDGGIVEKAVLPVKAGLEAEFELAFTKARWIIGGMPGFRELTLSRGIETPSTYLLLVRWDTIEDHEVGFRGSPEYAEWRAPLHHFYEPFPVVAHFVEVDRMLGEGEGR